MGVIPMSARVCKKCSINYPVGAGFVNCAICKGACTLKGKQDPDPDWERRVEIFRSQEDEELGDPVFVWRFSELLKAGFDPQSAEALADDRNVDLEQARSMVKRGCAPELAMSILS